MPQGDSNPYRPPTPSGNLRSNFADVLSPIIIRWALIGTAVYVPILLIAMFILNGSNKIPTALVAIGVSVHVMMMVINLCAFVFTIRDWQSRQFSSRWAKWGWLIGFIYTGGICWVWYIFRFNLLYRTSEKRR